MNHNHPRDVKYWREKLGDPEKIVKLRIDGLNIEIHFRGDTFAPQLFIEGTLRYKDDKKYKYIFNAVDQWHSFDSYAGLDLITYLEKTFGITDVRIWMVADSQ